MKNRAAYWVAVWFGCGLFPWGPGTIGSLGALLPAFFLSRIPGWHPAYFALLALLSLYPAIRAADLTATALHRKDPGLIVVDEVVGQWLTLAGALRLNSVSWVAAFVLFRIFDIAKPFPIRRLERLAGGSGIVMDDVGAGIAGALVLSILGWFNLY